MEGAGAIVRAIKQQAQASAARVLKAKIGYITSYDPKTYTVRVRVEPESSANESRGMLAVETNWLPILRVYGGDGWGMICPPKASPTKPYGDQCLVLWPDDGHGVALIGFFNDQEQAFQGPDTGEMWFVHKKGGYIRLMNDGGVYIQGEDGNQVRVQNDGAVQLQGQSGALLHVKSSSPGSIGSVAASVSGVVTKQDLQAALNLVVVALATKQSGASSQAAILATASTSVEVTD